MNKHFTKIVLIPMLWCGAAIGDNEYVDPYALEPSINGGVSASGLFASQAEEDAYLADLQADKLAEELEPCINGGVSANGLFASQVEEDAFTDSIATE